MKGNPDQPMCGFSKAVVQILDIHGTSLVEDRAGWLAHRSSLCLGVEPDQYSSFNVLEDEDIRQAIKEYSSEIWCAQRGIVSH